MGYKLTWAYIGSQKVRPKIIPDYLCFTANTAGSTVALNRTKSSVRVPAMETSTDLETWTAYTVWSTITLSNIWDKIYWRTSRETTAPYFSQSSSLYIYFSMTGSIACSWELWYLLNKNGTDTMEGTSPTFYYLFSGCPITSCPKINFTNTTQGCYYGMFWYCTSLETLPKLYATSIADSSCYYGMFRWCSKIKISATQTWDYQTEYRIPIEWTATMSGSTISDMFKSTWWSFTSDPYINTTYYTSNTLV